MKLKESEEDEELDEETADTAETEETEETEESEETEEADEGEDSGEEEPAAASETDNVGDPSVEINVEELIHEIEAEGDGSRPGRELAAKRRLEDLMEKKRSKRELEDFEDYDI